MVIDTPDAAWGPEPVEEDAAPTAIGRIIANIVVSGRALLGVLPGLTLKRVVG